MAKGGGVPLPEEGPIKPVPAVDPGKPPVDLPPVRLSKVRDGGEPDCCPCCARRAGLGMAAEIPERRRPLAKGE